MKSTNIIAVRNRFALAAALFLSLVSVAATSSAAPITLQFDAQVTNVPSGNSFDLGLSYGIGDVISGTFTFEPGPGVPVNSSTVRSTQNFAFDFEINGTQVHTIGYDIVAFNDNTDFDSELQNPRDGLTVSCREPSCNPSVVTLPQGEPFRVRFDLKLLGNSSVWSVPEIPGILDTWNAFAVNRSISLGFDNVGPGSMGFDAIVGPVTLVPEPCGATIALCICNMFACHVRWQRRK